MSVGRKMREGQGGSEERGRRGMEGEKKHPPQSNAPTVELHMQLQCIHVSRISHTYIINFIIQ